jgi:hypothetical protein
LYATTGSSIYLKAVLKNNSKVGIASLISFGQGGHNVQDTYVDIVSSLTNVGIASDPVVLMVKIDIVLFEKLSCIAVALFSVLSIFM